MKIAYKYEIEDGRQINADEIINILLKSRGIKDKKLFLNPPSPQNISLKDIDVDLVPQYQKAYIRLTDAREKGEMIIVYTDYDADGITGGTVLWESLHLMGFKTMPYVPHRLHEGYGFSQVALDTIKKEYNPGLIISVDHGITAVEQVTYAKKLGIDVIITDHHLKPALLPDAHAIIHTSLLSGSTVAYFFAKELFKDLKKNKVLDHTSTTTQLDNHFENDYLAISTIGLISDLVPLVGIARATAAAGLIAFLKVNRIGLTALLKEAGIEHRKITPYEIGYIIAPRINAAGRLGHAMNALRLLCTNNPQRAQQLAQELGEVNIKRQSLLDTARVEAIELVKQKCGENLPILITLYNKKWHEGIIGLVASYVAQEFYRPAIVMTDSGSGIKGSARSISGFAITDFLKEQKDLLLSVGGHTQAAGFSLERKNLERFIARIESESKNLIKNKDLEPKIEADFKIPLSMATIDLARGLACLEPYGISNPQPLFYSQGKIVNIKYMGKKMNHAKIILQEIDNPSNQLESLLFFHKKNQVQLNSIVDVVYSVEINKWNHSEKLQGMIKYLRADIVEFP